MKKRNNHGFIFIDLLLATTISIMIITAIFSHITLFTFYYSIHKDYLAAYEIISQLSSFLPQKHDIISLEVNGKKSDIHYGLEIIEHTPLYDIKKMPLCTINISWKNFYNQQTNILMKFLHET